MTATVALAAPPVRATAALVAAVSALAACGGALAVAMLLNAGERPYLTREAPSPGAWRATTSFGSLSVQRVERFAGAPGGLGHAGMRRRADRLRITLSVTNSGHRGMPFSPGQLRLGFGGRRSGIPPTRPNPPPGSIAGGATLGQQLEFIVPSTRASFALAFADIGRRRSARIELGALPGRGRR